MIRAIAIDDEPKAISIIKNHASKIVELDLIQTFNDPFVAHKFIEMNSIDLIFLDINMPQLSGLELLEKLEVQPLVIITSAYAQYGVESYAFDTIDYLLKPFELDRFEKAVYKAQERLSLSPSNFIFIKDGYQQVRINTSEILYIKSDGNYLDIHSNKQKISPRMTFTKLLEMLPEDHFIRVHNSYVVNLNKIERIQSGVLKLGGYTIPVSNSYKELLETKLKS